MHFGKIYVISVCIFFVSFALSGLFLDKFGPKLCSTIGIILIIIGSILLSESKSATIDLYLPGLIVLGFGGPAVYISSFHFSNLYGSASKQAMSILVGFMVGSSIVYLIFAKLIENGVAPAAVFRGHYIWLCILGVLQYFVQPNEVYNLQSTISFPSSLTLIIYRREKIEDVKSRPCCTVITMQSECEVMEDDLRDDVDGNQCSFTQDGNQCSFTQGEEKENLKELALNHVSDANFSDVTGDDSKDLIFIALKSRQFLAIAVFVALHVLRFNYYLATGFFVFPQYHYFRFCRLRTNFLLPIFSA